MTGRWAALLIAAATALVPAGARAEDWPTRPVHVIVGAGPGGGTDIVTRIIGQPLSELLG
jgi:tripartite-type tricarboxylate transporter receptor subunit TctC